MLDSLSDLSVPNDRAMLEVNKGRIPSSQGCRQARKSIAMRATWRVSGAVLYSFASIARKFGKTPMPIVSQFFGIVIQMFWREPAPPHFHVLYGEFEALIDFARWK